MATTTVALLGAGAPTAHASGSLSAGMEINIGKHRCSLGFFGFNANHDRLAVSAGHCADDVDQTVYSSNGTEIGTVVSHKPDSDSLDGIRPRGYTLILIYREFSIEPFFTGIADAHTGDSVTKFGARSGKQPAASPRRTTPMGTTRPTKPCSPMSSPCRATRAALVQQRADFGRHFGQWPLRQRRW